ncbi:hypothetical protein [Halopiger xanaduensis]|uniref:Uncharacterized protein n=1 Tax=Halopiger xanaduensis (strain DSM 18323 / JCM 14033 / SH-6) TaxID=797210 RepID=F8DAY2_HALXS|nr:hypothetical protein [Halopiger xanaduensis]AEH38223.1 hypothetical protein Halxa_3614 [Halopiger xanaduensis SH-6]
MPTHLGSVVSALGFWVGALFPIAYLPVFVAGIDSPGRLSLFLGLVTINVLALVVGHDYPASRANEQRG